MVLCENLHIHTDGASRGNPGKAAIGIIFYDEKRNELDKQAECIGIATNNEAEYRAIITALEMAAKYSRKNLLFFSDSEFVVKQLTGLYSVKDERMRKLYNMVKSGESMYASVKYNHIMREENRQADALANAALDSA